MVAVMVGVVVVVDVIVAMSGDNGCVESEMHVVVLMMVL